MIETLTINDQITSLFRAPPHWSQGAVKVSHTLTTTTTESKTGREARTPAYSSIRHELSCRYVLSLEDAERMRDILLQFERKPLAIPLWPGAMPTDRFHEGIYTADSLFNYDATGYTYRPATELPDYQYTYTTPLLIGFLKEPPQLDVRTKALSLTLVEDSAYALSIRPNAASLTFTDAFPGTLFPDGTRNIDTASDTLQHHDTPQGRERPVTGDEAPPKWQHEATFQLNSLEKIRTLLGFWASRHARSKAFDTPVWFRASTDVPENTVTRFSTDTLTLNFTTNAHATSALRFHQLPWEDSAEAIDPGGPQPTRTYLLEFTYQTPTAVISRYTPYERDITVGSATYTTQPSFKISRPKDQFVGVKSEWSFECHTFPGNPLLHLIPFQLEAELHLNLYEATLTDPENPTTELIFSGHITEARARGRSLSFTAGSFIESFDRPVPRFRIQRSCNYQVFDPHCGVNESEHRRTATITVTNGATYVDYSGPTEPPGYFNGGRLILGDGPTYETRPITRHTATQLHILKPLRHHNTTGAQYTATLLPGCDGEASTCRNKFSNYPRFGGFPYIPLRNPTIQPIESSQPDLAKK